MKDAVPVHAYLRPNEATQIQRVSRLLLEFPQFSKEATDGLGMCWISGQVMEFPRVVF